MVASVFMILGSLPFALYLIALRGNSRPLLRDSQVHFFLGMLVVLILVAWVYQIYGEVNEAGFALQLAIFNVISVVTGTGYATTDYGLWGGFSLIFFFCIMFLGGCAGSTSCGLKVFRLQVILETVRISVNRMLYPSGVFPARYNGKRLEDNVIAAVMTFVSSCSSFASASWHWPSTWWAWTISPPCRPQQAPLPMWGQGLGTLSDPPKPMDGCRMWQSGSSVSACCWGGWNC